MYMNDKCILASGQKNPEGLKMAAESHLQKVIIPFWKGLCDKEHGGYYGYVDSELRVKQDAVKGCILNSRILWFFSNASLALNSEECLRYARHAYEFLRKNFIDNKYGGVYWSVNCDGSVNDSAKHVYNQAFAIYALSSYYEAAGDEDALNTAWDLYWLTEGRCRDGEGYNEAFSRDFTPVDNEQLSENGVMAQRTMNTLLHVFEAYTQLYRVTGDERVGKRIREILGLFEKYVYNPKLCRQEVFFDREWNTLIDLHSYGHDIEASWLLDLGCRVLDDEKLGEKADLMTSSMARQVYKSAYRNNSLRYECERGTENEMRVWWVQAEAVVGFFNAWEKSPDAGIFLEAACDIWNFIMENIVDSRDGSEWFEEVDQYGAPNVKKPIADPWKCPYHNGRMCLELIKRIKGGND